MHFGLQTETVQHPENLTLVGIALLGVVAFGQALVFAGKAQSRFGVSRFQQFLDLRHAAFHDADGLEHLKQRTPNGIGQGNVVQLGQIADAQVFVAVDSAAVRLHFPGDHAHKGGLTAAVNPYKAHFFALLQAEGNAAENFVNTEALLELLNGNKDHAGQAFLWKMMKCACYCAG